MSHSLLIADESWPCLVCLPIFDHFPKNSSGSGLTVKTDASAAAATLEADCLLWAIGRNPNVESLGLSKAGVDTTPRGHIVVDAYQGPELKFLPILTNLRFLLKRGGDNLVTS